MSCFLKGSRISHLFQKTWEPNPVLPKSSPLLHCVLDTSRLENSLGKENIHPLAQVKNQPGNWGLSLCLLNHGHRLEKPPDWLSSLDPAPFTGSSPVPRLALPCSTLAPTQKHLLPILPLAIPISPSHSHLFCAPIVAGLPTGTACSLRWHKHIPLF